MNEGDTATVEVKLPGDLPAPASGNSAIIEAPFHRAFSQEVIERIAARHGIEVAQVLLAANPATLEARYRARQSSEDRHPDHDVGFTLDELRAAVDQQADGSTRRKSHALDGMKRWRKVPGHHVVNIIMELT